MLVRTRVSLAVLSANAAVLLLLMFLFHAVLSRDFNLIEEHEVQQHIKRSQLSLAASRENLITKINDWAKWDDTYEFMKKRNADYFDSVVTYDYVVSLGIDHILYIDNKRKAVRGFTVDRDNQQMKALSSQLTKEITDHHLLSNPTETEPVAGFIRFNEGLFLAGSVAIQDSEISKPKEGSIVFLRAINKSYWDAISKQIQLDLEANPVDSKEHLTEEQQRLFSSSLKKPLVEASSTEVISGYHIEKDLENSPIFLIKISQPRPVYAQAINTRNSVLAVLLIGTICSALLVLLLFHSAVISQLNKLKNQANKIAQNREFNQRIKLDGNDELSSLACDINSMLGALDQSSQEIISARDAAQSANAAKSSFIAKVSHELRTPIHGILGMHRMILKQEKSRSVRELLKVANNSARGLLTTINEILDFSKAESGNLTLEHIPFELREVVREALQVVSGRLDPLSPLELVCDMDPRVPSRFNGDPTKLKQVLVNLLGNAIKFTEKGYVALRVNMWSVKGEEQLHIEVADTGIGIPAEKLESIFDPFRQADDSTTRQYQGTGLGLTIVKQFCEALGGAVSVSSTVGQGSTFTVSLPLPILSSGDVLIGNDIQDWPVALLVGAEPHTTSTITKNLSAVGVRCMSIKADSDDSLEMLDQYNEASLIVVFDKALKRSKVFNLVAEKANSKEGCLVTVVNAANLHVREKLYSLGVKYVLSSPIVPDDLLRAFFGKLPESVQSFEENDEASLYFTKKLNILVADDVATNRTILQNMLGDAGHKVHMVNNGQEMLDLLTLQATKDPKAMHFDVVLTDIQMPILDGFTATKMLRAAEKNAGKGVHVPIIAVTAHALKEEHSRMIEAGIDGVVTKPIEPIDLAGELIRVLDLKPEESKISYNQNATKVISTEIDLDWQLQHVISQLSKQHLKGIEADSLLNVSYVHRRLGNSVSRTAAVLKAFNESFQSPLEKLTNAEKENNPEELRKAAHSLKGLFLDIGAKQPGEVASMIEQYCMDQKGEEAKRLVASLKDQTLLVAEISSRLTATLEMT